jgi:hypothetical protein
LEVWQAILRLWPAFLIALGIDLLIGRRSTWGALIALVLILAVFVGSVFLLPLVDSGMERVQIGGYSWDPEQVEQALVDIQSTWTTLRVGALSGEGTLAEGEIELGGGERLVDDFVLEGESARLALRSQGGAFNVFGFAGLRDWDLGLSPEIPLNLRVQVSVGQADLDLTDLQLADLDVRVILGQAVVTLPSEGDFDVRIEGVFGETVVVIPHGLPVRILFDTGLASRMVPVSYTKQGDDVYISPTYGEAASRVEIVLAQPIGVVRVRESGAP